jgi:alpha-beta hydrolase superfamily lysophospholipase
MQMLNKPVLVMHGTSDQITSHKASETFAQAALSNATLKLWPDMRHETHNEFGKEEVLEYLTKWLVKMTV